MSDLADYEDYVESDEDQAESNSPESRSEATSSNSRSPTSPLADDTEASRVQAESEGSNDASQKRLEKERSSDIGPAGSRRHSIDDMPPVNSPITRSRSKDSVSENEQDEQGDEQGDGHEDEGVGLSEDGSTLVNADDTTSEHDVEEIIKNEQDDEHNNEIIYPNEYQTEQDVQQKGKGHDHGGLPVGFGAVHCAGCADCMDLSW